MRSMTGCGTGRASCNGWEVTVEIKTVNHRFLDLGLRLPRNLSFLEQTLRSGIAARIKRGHADLFVNLRNTDTSTAEVKADALLARAYCDAFNQIAEAAGTRGELTTSELIRMEGVLTLSERETDEETVSEVCSDALQKALDQLVQMRETEGENLRSDLNGHLDKVAELREKILTRAPNVVSEYREKLRIRLDTVLEEKIDPQRLAQEVALLADRCAIDEELSRLESHIQQMRTYLDAEGEIGKKMDFLIQEMNRETNTIGSKASDAEITQLVVDLKSEIEKLREQIQNVE